MLAYKLNYYRAPVTQPLFPANKCAGVNISTRFVSWILPQKRWVEAGPLIHLGLNAMFQVAVFGSVYNDVRFCISSLSALLFSFSLFHCRDFVVALSSPWFSYAALLGALTGTAYAGIGTG